MNYKKKYKEEILDSINPNTSLDEIKSRLSFREKSRLGGELFMKKGLVYGLSVAGVLVLAGGVTAGVLLSKNNSNRSKYKSAGEESIIKMEVNPSISFSVDKDNIVTAISGDNNEGKMIILEESLKGLPLEEAIAKVIEIENETGYIVSGSIEEDENNIKFTINVDDAKAKEILNGLIEDTVSKVSEELDIETKLNMLDSYSKDQMVSTILKLDPSYDEEELKSKSYDELIDILDGIMLEREHFYSNEIEEYYAQVKEYEFNLAEDEWVRDTISNVGGLCGAIYSAASTAIESATGVLNVAVDTLNDLRYNLFVSENSAYQTVYGTFLEAKSLVVETKNRIANIKNEDAKAKAMEELDKEIEAMGKIETKLEEIKEAALAEIDSSVESVNSAIATINGIIDELPGQDVIEKALKEKADEHSKYLNDKKAELIETFETEYKDDLEKAKDTFDSYRSELKAKIKAARA